MNGSLRRAVIAAGLLCALAAPPAGAATRPEAETDDAAERAADLYEEAIARFGRGDYDGALLQLKSALQQNPRDLSARILAGTVYLRMRNGAAAEKELKLALEYGADRGHVVVPLGNAYLLQGQYRTLLFELRPLGDIALDADIHMLRGLAQMRLHQLDDADRSFREALFLRPGHAEAMLGRARVAMRRGDLVAAEDLIDEATAEEPSNAQAWYLKAEIRRTKRDLEGALEFFTHGLDLRPGHVPARTERAATLLELGRTTEARADIEQVLEQAPQDAKAAYLLALVNAREGDREAAAAAFARAADSIARLKSEFLASDSASLLLAGVIAYAQRDLERARGHLTQFLAIRPYHPGARKMLGGILLAQGEPEEAVSTLLPAVRLAPDDPGALLLLGNAYLATGEPKLAAESLERAAALAPDDPALFTRLALSRLAVGHSDAGLSGLERALAAERGFTDDSEAARAAMLLALVQVRRGDQEGAARAIEALRKRLGDTAVVRNLEGVAALARGDREAARGHWEQALRVDAGFAPARHNLAKLYQSEGELGAATGQYRVLLEADPADTQALFQIAVIAEQEGRIDRAIEWLEKLRAVDPGAVPAQIRLADLYLQTDRVSLAQSLAEELAGKHDEDLGVLGVLGRVYLRQDRKDVAKLLFARMARYAGHHPANLYRVAQYQVEVGDFDGATWTLRKAVQADPDFLPAIGALVRIMLRTGKSDEALTMATEVREQRPGAAFGHVLVGEVLLQTDRAREAIEAFRAGQEVEPNAELLVRIYQARRALGEGDQALDALERWVRDHPEDVAVRRALASSYIDAGRTAEALALHEQLERETPGDALVLNNLAWLYLKTGDARAAEYARRAHELRPSDPVVLDTYGWVLIRSGSPAKGLRYLREAYSRAAGDVEVRYHVAVALQLLGRDEESVHELEAVVASGEQFDGAEHARELLRELRGG